MTDRVLLEYRLLNLQSQSSFTKIVSLRFTRTMCKLGSLLVDMIDTQLENHVSHISFIWDLIAYIQWFF